MSGSSVRAVGVIGAGGSGVAAATALQRAGSDFEILEARDGVGGSWRFDPEGDGSACYASLVANTSKLRMQIFGRRIGGRLWQYASHREMLGYLESIADQRRPASPPAAGMAGGGGKPCRRGLDAPKRGGEERRYRAVICALGVNGRPRWASLRGDFAGEQLHSAVVSNAAALQGQGRRRRRARDVGHGDRWGSGGARPQRRRCRANADVGDDAAARRLTDRLARQPHARASLPLGSATPNDRGFLHSDDRRSAPPRPSTPDASLR